MVKREERCREAMSVPNPLMRTLDCGPGACAPSPVAINYTCCWLGITHVMRSASAKDRDSRLPKPATRRLIESFARKFIQRNFLRSTLVLLLVSLQVFPASAWVFPEHRDIAALARSEEHTS